MASELRVMRPRRATPADAVRPTRAEVNLEALRHNLHAVQKRAGQAEVWAVLKADGYGHGAPAVARTLERAGAKGFCVALLEEGVELREAGIRAPILVMGGYYGAAYDELLARRLTPVVYDFAQIEGFARLVRSRNASGPVEVHLNVDTGMARLGVRLPEVEAFVARLGHYPEVQVTGLMTHFASADAPSLEVTQGQMVQFERAQDTLRRHGIVPRVRHAANSAALLRGQACLELVRPGIAMFGVSPRVVVPGSNGEARPLATELRPVMRVRTEIVALRHLDVGDTVSYGGLFRATRPTRVATIPMGYADGLSRHLTNRGQVLVRGRRAPVVGAVSMDMSMIDVTDHPGVRVRDEVVVVGNQEGPLGSDIITVDEVAHWSDAIPWEVPCGISRRVPRFYREP